MGCAGACGGGISAGCFCGPGGCSTCGPNSCACGPDGCNCGDRDGEQPCTVCNTVPCACGEGLADDNATSETSETSLAGDTDNKTPDSEWWDKDWDFSLKSLEIDDWFLVGGILLCGGLMIWWSCCRNTSTIQLEPQFMSNSEVQPSDATSLL